MNVVATSFGIWKKPLVSSSGVYGTRRAGGGRIAVPGVLCLFGSLLGFRGGSYRALSIFLRGRAGFYGFLYHFILTPPLLCGIPLVLFVLFAPSLFSGLVYRVRFAIFWTHSYPVSRRSAGHASLHAYAPRTTRCASLAAARTVSLFLYEDNLHIFELMARQDAVLRRGNGHTASRRGWNEDCHPNDERTVT
jgi:hypothetical protein